MREHNFEARPKQSQYSSKADLSASYSGHFYELYKAKNIYQISKNFTQSRFHEGLKGYILTITSHEENKFIEDLLKANQVESVWLGAHDSDKEGEWKWNNLEGGAPEAGKLFYRKEVPTTSAAEQNSDQTINNNDTENKLYSNWKEGEPNDADADEDCAVSTIGGWNDVRCELILSALVVEFGSAELEQLSHEAILSSSNDKNPKNDDDHFNGTDGRKKSHEEL